MYEYKCNCVRVSQSNVHFSTFKRKCILNYADCYKNSGFRSYGNKGARSTVEYTRLQK